MSVFRNLLNFHGKTFKSKIAQNHSAWSLMIWEVWRKEERFLLQRKQMGEKMSLYLWKISCSRIQTKSSKSVQLKENSQNTNEGAMNKILPVLSNSSILWAFWTRIKIMENLTVFSRKDFFLDRMICTDISGEPKIPAVNHNWGEFEICP